ncbi:MAG: permease prefix domain 2-containing transporter, partial [Cytophagales bacterium]
MNKENTKWPIHFLRWFCPAELREEIEGDLIQKFNRDVNTVGAKRAKQRLLWNVIRFFRPGILLRNKIGNHLNVSIMLTSYLRTMSRSLAKQKLNTTISIAGLTIGIFFSLIIGIFAWSELQVNRNIADVDRTYLLETKQKEGDGNQPPFFVPAMLGPTVVNQNTTLFENSYRFRDRNITVSKGNRHFRIQSMIGDSTFIRMFGFPVLFGSSKRALTDPNSIVITKKIALQFFGKPDVVGETLTLATTPFKLCRSSWTTWGTYHMVHWWSTLATGSPGG